MKFKKFLTMICTIGFVLSTIAFVSAQELILVSQNPCPPCKVVKKLLEKHKADKEFQDYTIREWDRFADRRKIEALEALGMPPIVRTPTLLKLDHEGKFLQSITMIDETILKDFAADFPAPIPFRPMQLEPFIETFATPSANAQGPRIITFDIATQYRDGSYNRTFPWEDVAYAMNSLGRYYNLEYRRVSSGGQWHIIQANTIGGKDWSAWTNGANTYISPVFRYYNKTQGRMVVLHERGHVGGRGHHNIFGGLMYPNGGYKLLVQDQSYFNGTPWKSSLRPEQEPDWLKAYLSVGVQSIESDDYIPFPLLNVQGK